ncbi:MAG: antitoxin [Thermoplasmata archaeon]
MSVTISIRVDDDIKKNIEELGYQPGEYLKKILIRELKKERSRNTISWLKKNRLKTKGKSTEDLIREDRDSR